MKIYCIVVFVFLIGGCAAGREEIETWGRENNVDNLVKVLKNSQSPYRVLAASTLGRVGDRRAVNPLLLMLKEENPQLQIAAISALGKIGDKKGVDPLIAFLREGYSGLSASHASGMVREAPRGRKKRQGGEGFDTYRKKVSIRARLRKEAILALGNIGDRRAVDIISGAIWDGRSEEVSIVAVETLTELGGEKTTEAFIDAFRTCNSRIRQIAAHALARLRLPPIEILDKTLEDENPCLREGAAQAIGLIGELPAVKKLIRMLADENYGVQLQVSAALVRIGKKAVPALVEALEGTGVSVRKWAARTLGMIREPQAIVPLMRASGDESLLVRQAAASALNELAGKTNNPIIHLLARLPFTKAEEKVLLIEEIARNKDARAVPALKAEARDPNPNVQKAAKRALDDFSLRP